jgi:hypothetical protein
MPLEFYVCMTAIWIIPSILTAMIAAEKGRSFGKWLVIGLIFSPGFAILMALFLRKTPSKATIKKYAFMARSEPPSAE